jgi:hypothetical protein
MAMPVMHLSSKRVSYAALPSVADICLRKSNTPQKLECLLLNLRPQTAARRKELGRAGLTSDRREVALLHFKISSHQWIVRQSYFSSLGRGGMQPLKQVRQAHFSNSE